MIVVVAVLVIIVDQLSKCILSHYLSLHRSVPIIKHCFHLTLVHNTGIAFGMLKGNSHFILLVTVVGLMLIVWHLKKEFADNLTKQQGVALCEMIAVGLILGGALANMIDRLRLGYVVDFLDFRIWPVFNVADSCITVGALILLFKVFFPSPR